MGLVEARPRRDRHIDMRQTNLEIVSASRCSIEFRSRAGWLRRLRPIYPLIFNGVYEESSFRDRIESQRRHGNYDGLIAGIIYRSGRLRYEYVGTRGTRTGRAS